MKYSDDEYRNETLRVMAACDWASGLKLAREEGFAEGFIKSFVETCPLGAEKGLLLATKELLLKGFDLSVIADATGFDVAKINKLRAELQK